MPICHGRIKGVPAAGAFFKHMRSEIITVFGEPKGKARPRFTRSGHTYTPASTKKYEKLFADAWGDLDPIEDLPVRVVITAYLKIPKSAPKHRRMGMMSGDVIPVKKPDIDNIAKAVLDGLNGHAFADDKQVAALTVRKLYDSTPRVEVKVEEIVP